MLLGGDGSKRVDSDVKVDGGDLDLPLPQTGCDLLGEMKAGGGGGRRTNRAGEHRLVPIGIVQGALEVGRERDVPGVGYGCLDVGSLEVDHDHPFVGAVHDRGPDRPDLDNDPGPESSRWPGQRLPKPVGAGLEHEQLDRTAGVESAAREPGRPYPGLIDYHQVTGLEQRRQVEETMV